MAAMSATLIGLVGVSVRLVCGIWGSRAVGIFGNLAGGAQLVSQIIGIVAIGIFTFAFAFILFSIIKATMGLRVSPDEESEGLDVGEHGNVAYGASQMFSPGSTLGVSSQRSMRAEPVPRLGTEEA